MPNALDRLNNLSSDEDVKIDDYINDNTNDIIGRMNTFSEVTVDPKPESEPVQAEGIEINIIDTGDSNDVNLNEELFNNNSNPQEQKAEHKRRGRRKKDNIEPIMNTTADIVVNNTNIDSNPLYDQLAKNLIEELRKRKFTFSGFNIESMQILYNYIQSRF